MSTRARKKGLTFRAFCVILPSLTFVGLVILFLASSVKAPPNVSLQLYVEPDNDYSQAYADYLARSGVDVKVHYVIDAYDLQLKEGVPNGMLSNHIGFLEADGKRYFVVGFVPVDVIYLLVTRKPDVAGITLPGRPAGVPGTSDEQTSDWNIFAISSDGMMSRFAVVSSSVGQTTRR